MIPTILEIPSKDQPYDATKDSIMHRVNMVLGIQGQTLCQGFGALTILDVVYLDISGGLHV